MPVNIQAIRKTANVGLILQIAYSLLYIFGALTQKIWFPIAAKIMGFPDGFAANLVIMPTIMTIPALQAGIFILFWYFLTHFSLKPSNIVPLLGGIAAAVEYIVLPFASRGLSTLTSVLLGRLENAEAVAGFSLVSQVLSFLSPLSSIAVVLLFCSYAMLAYQQRFYPNPPQH